MFPRNMIILIVNYQAYMRMIDFGCYLTKEPLEPYCRIMDFGCNQTNISWNDIELPKDEIDRFWM